MTNLPKDLATAAQRGQSAVLQPGGVFTTTVTCTPGRPDRGNEIMTTTPETTILIRAFNEERWLPEVFEALGKQRYRDFEVLLVDSGLTDHTLAISASANGARIVRLRSEDFTFGHSLDVGVKESKGQFIAILSAWMPSRPMNRGSTVWLPRRCAVIRWRWCTAASADRMSRSSRKRAISNDCSPEQQHDEVDPGHSVRQQRELVDPPAYLWEQHPFDEGLPGLEDIEWAKHWMECGRTVT